MKELDVIAELKSFPDDSLIFIRLKDDVNARQAAESMRFTMERLRRLAKENQKFIVLHRAEVIAINPDAPYVIVEVASHIDDLEVASMSAQMSQAIGTEVRVLRVPEGAKVRRC